MKQILITATTLPAFDSKVNGHLSIPGTKVVPGTLVASTSTSAYASYETSPGQTNVHFTERYAVVIETPE